MPRIPLEQLVAAISRQADLHMVSRKSRHHEEREARRVGDGLIHRCESGIQFLKQDVRIYPKFVMLGIAMSSDERSHVGFVRRSDPMALPFKSDGKGARRKAHLMSNGNQQRRIDPARKKKADRYVCDDLPPYRREQYLFKVPSPCGGKSARRQILCLPVGQIDLHSRPRRQLSHPLNQRSRLGHPALGQELGERAPIDSDRKFERAQGRQDSPQLRGEKHRIGAFPKV